ncbi:MAG: DUF305 domain-containing protein [Acidimicrobiia bacterium]|jgi:uncharacterized protein (DUF305 family)|nr:DUF305 domain-containing protein [Acidimicrobiia bacterium]
MRPISAAACALVVLFGASCASDEDPEVDTGAGVTSEEGGEESAEDMGDMEEGMEEDMDVDPDVEFLQNMLVHHEQAVAMNALAADAAESPDVVALAEEIDATHVPEIEEMQTLLESLGEEELGAMGGMDMSTMDNMDGMLTDDQFAELEDASGTEFDQLYLEGMITHHEGAVTMADREISEGDEPEAVTLAESIKEEQEAMIPEMEDLLATLGG